MTGGGSFSGRPVRFAGCRVAVLVPALDEEDALPRTFDALPDGVVQDLVVVDNGSRDRTPEVARRAGAAVLFESERGYGAACLAGIEHLASLPEPPDVLVFLDADATTEAPHLPELVRPVAEGRADLVLGVRRAPGGARGNAHSHARAGNRIVLALTRLLFGFRFRDLAPFRAIRFSSLQDLAMDDRNWGWTLQMQIRAARAGLRIREIPVLHAPRAAGRSKISGSLGTSLRVGLKMFYTLARERFRPT